MNPRNKVLEKRGLAGEAGTQAPVQKPGQFNFENPIGTVNQPPKELDPVLQQKLEYYNSPYFIKTTSTVFPENPTIHQRCALPCAAIIQPYMNTTVPMVTDVDPLRCNKCKTFCNPFWEFIEKGRRVRCNICGDLNQVDARHFSELGEDGYPANVRDRVELMNGCFEICVGEDFSNKTPSYPSYLFVVDVSQASVKAGIAQSAFAAIHAAIKGAMLCGQRESTFGIVCIDTKLHLIKFSSFLNRLQIVTMSGNFETCPVPPAQLLISLDDLSSEDVLDSLLSLHEAFAQKAEARSSIPVKSIILLANM